MFTVMRAERARQRFADVRRVAETGSTNADVLALAQQGEPEGIVLVADHQTAGRGRQHRTWQTPPGSSLLVSVLLRPPAPAVGATTMAMAVAAAEAVEEVAGFSPGLKWPNDLVVSVANVAPIPGGSDRKLAGILAEADWPPASSPTAISPGAGWSPPADGQRVAVVVGMGLNVNWPIDLPEELIGTATALNHVVGHDVDREAVLGVLLHRLDRHYADLATGDPSRVMGHWRRRSATLGRRVRVDLGARDVVGTAIDVSADGHLVVEIEGGGRRTFAAGDVVHLRQP